jgi:hypothetical protein
MLLLSLYMLAVVVTSSLSYDDTYSCVDSSSVIALSLF